MGNTWESLDPATKQQIAAQALQGQRKNPENLNRVMQQLSMNPTLVDRYMKEAGFEPEDTTLQEGPTIDDKMGDLMAESAASDVQETGKVSGDIPPAEPGESMEEYIMRLAQLQAGNGTAIPRAR